MKNSGKLLALLIVTTIIFIGLACQADIEPTTDSNEQAEYQADLPLIYHMAFLDRFAAKLYFAGQEENWKLADIYMHELEEISEIIIDGEYIDEDINRSELMETILSPQLELMEQAIDAQDTEMFEERYQTMINSCNQCHTLAEYGLIQITIPADNLYNQDFSR